jgi:hypothetical protein
VSVSKRDPFRPPAHEDRPIDLAEHPAARTAEVEGPLLEVPTVRKPLRYRPPRTSWLTVVVLGFAGVGLVAVAGLAFKKVKGLSLPIGHREQPVERPVVYHELPQDNAVLVEVRVTPRDARLILDGEPVTSNPLRVARGPGLHKLAATAEGYAPLVEEFTADGPRTLHLRLPRAR